MKKEKSETKEKKIIPFKKALLIFVVWAALLSEGGYILYEKVLKKYIVNAPTVIKVDRSKDKK